MRQPNFLLISLLALLVLAGCRNNKPDEEQDVMTLPNEEFFDIMKPYLLQGYQVKMIPKGNSMLPTLHGGVDVVTIKADSNFQVKDVVLANMGKGHYVMHRIVEINGDKITLKGDNNKKVEHTTADRIMAKMVDFKTNNDSDGMPEVGMDMLEHSFFRVVPRCRLDAWLDYQIVVDTVAKVLDMRKIVSFNETAMSIWRQLPQGKFNVKDMVNVVTNEYEVDEQRAQKDCLDLLKAWLVCGLVEPVD